MDFIKGLFSLSSYVFWVESLVIVAILVFAAYIAISLNLFKKD